MSQAKVQSFSVSIHTTLAEAVSKMATERLKRVLVLGADGREVGVLTSTQALNLLAEILSNETSFDVNIGSYLSAQVVRNHCLKNGISGKIRWTR